VNFNQDAGAPKGNLPGVVAVQVLIGVDGRITGDDTAAVEPFGKVTADKSGIFVRVAMLGTGQKGHAGRGMMGHTHDDVRAHALLYDQE
jgi:hypothetical protein